MGALLILCSVFTAVCSRQLVDEFKAWTPWMIGRLVSFAVRLLPEDRRERYGEEWSSYVTEIPGEIGKILTALGFSMAAFRISFESRKESKRAAIARRRSSNEIVLIALFLSIVLMENRKVRHFVLLFVLGAAILVCRLGTWLGLSAQRQVSTLTIDEGVLLIIVYSFFLIAARSLGNKSPAMAI